MKALLAACLMTASFAAFADHVDVIEVKLKPDCKFETYMAITKDFNEKFGKNLGYHAEILMPLQSPELTSLYWVGRSANAAAFGTAWDAWRDGLSDANSVSAKLWSRFQQCSENVARRGYDTY